MSVRLPENEVKMINSLSNSLNRGFHEYFQIDTSANNIIFYFLFLKKEGFSADLLNDSDSTENQIQKFLYSLNPDYKESYSEIINFYAPVVKKIKKGDLIELFREWDYLCNSLEKDFFNNFFLEIFDATLLIWSVFDESSLIPKELSRLMSTIIPLKKGSKIFSPYAGEANTAVFTSNENVYYGQEPDPFRYIVGKLRVLSCDYPKNKFLEFGNIEKEWTPYDLVITDPFSIPTMTSPFYKSKNLLKYSGLALALPLLPFLGVLAAGYASAKAINASSDEINKNLDFLLKKGLDELNDFGNLVILVPDSFLYESTNRANRRELINKDFLEFVISLPPGILKRTSIKTSLLVINKNKINKGIVNFIDGSNFVSGSSSMNKQLNDYDLIDLIKHNQESSVFKKVKNDSIKNLDYILDFKRYTLENIEGIPLYEFLSIIPWEQNQVENIGKLVRQVKTKDLKDDKIDFNLLTNSLETIRYDINLQGLKESAILISLYNGNLKPTYFEYTGKTIYLDKKLKTIPLKINLNKIEKDYLISELLSDTVKEQITSLVTGHAVRILNIQDFLRIKINVPSLKEQKLVLQKLKESILQEKAKELGLENQLINLKKDFNDELGVKQHSMRQLLANVANAMYMLTAIMDRNNGVLKGSDVVSPTRGTLVSHTIESLNLSLEALKLEVNNLQTEDTFEAPSTVDLKRLLEETLNNYHNKSSNVHIDYKFDHLQFESENISDILVMCSEKSLRELLNNVFENADKHGFRDKNEKHTISINLFIENGKIVLQILNNGLPFPKGLKKDLGIKGQKAGETGNTGIGVWKIIEIAKHYNFDYNIIDEPNSDFPVGWQFKFNLTR